MELSKLSEKHYSHALTVPQDGTAYASVPSFGGARPTVNRASAKNVSWEIKYQDLEFGRELGKGGTERLRHFDIP